MADSENSRTLPSNRYRNLLPATERLLSELAGEGGANGGDPNEPLIRWAAWSLAHAECSQLCSVQQRLERELFRTAATQPMKPPASYQAGIAPTEAPEDATIPRERHASSDVPPSAKAEIAAHHRQWEATDEAIGHSRAKAAEDAASAREQLLAEKLWSVSGRSAVSAMAKLHCVIEQGEPVADCLEFPWPQIRSALADLLTASTPGAAAFRDHWEFRSTERLS